MEKAEFRSLVVGLYSAPAFLRSKGAVDVEAEADGDVSEQEQRKTTLLRYLTLDFIASPTEIWLAKLPAAFCEAKASGTRIGLHFTVMCEMMRRRAGKAGKPLGQLPNAG